jgi:hypothetical protein
LVDCLIDEKPGFALLIFLYFNNSGGGVSRNSFNGISLEMVVSISEYRCFFLLEGQGLFYRFVSAPKGPE